MIRELKYNYKSYLDRTIDRVHFQIATALSFRIPKGEIKIKNKFLFRESFMIFLEIFHPKSDEVDFAGKRNAYNKWLNNEINTRREGMIAEIKQEITHNQIQLKDETEDISYLQQNIELLTERQNQLSEEKNNYLSTFTESGEKIGLEQELDDISWNIESLERKKDELISILQVRHYHRNVINRTSDPVLTFHPDLLMIEMFEDDGLVYKCLTLEITKSNLGADPIFGASTIDLPKNLFSEIAEIQSDEEFHIKIAGEINGSVETNFTKHIYQDPVFKKRKLIFNATSFIPGYQFEIDPIDIYNINALMSKFGSKEKMTRLRVDLIPNKPVTFKIEPRGGVVTSRKIYNGDVANFFYIFNPHNFRQFEHLLGLSTQIKIKYLRTGFPILFKFKLSNYSLTIGLLPDIIKDYSVDFIYHQLGREVRNLPTSISQFLENLLSMNPQKYSQLQIDMDEFGEVEPNIQYLLYLGKAHYDTFTELIRFRDLYTDYHTSVNYLLTDEERKINESCSKFKEIIVSEVDNIISIQSMIMDYDIKLTLNIKFEITSFTCGLNHITKQNICHHIKALFFYFLQSPEGER